MKVKEMEVEQRPREKSATLWLRIFERFRVGCLDSSKRE